MADTLPALPPDLEPLLRPISPQAPSGRSLRYEPLYDQIREARREDDPTLPQGVWQVSLKRANWAQVSELCQRALSRETKDLQIAVWLTEAWLVQQGFSGLEQGLRLTAALVEHFWDTLWPALDGGDADARLTPLEWLDGRLPILLGNVPLLRTPAPGSLTYDFADWRQILLQEKQGGAPPEEAKTEDAPSPEQAPSGGAPLTRQRFLAAASLMPEQAFGTLTRQVTGVLESASALEQTLAARRPSSSFTLRRARATLGDIQALLTPLQAKASRKQPAAPPANTRSPESLPSATDAPGPFQSSIQSRGQAYQWLALAADYLRSTEPHSPVPYLVQRAIAWGQMPLEKLLSELVPDSSRVESIHTLLGMKKEE
jgi:type VI secretion system protein ImpA